MQTRRLRLGDVVDDYCPRERRLSNHVIAAMVDDTIKQTRCSTCDFEHPYKEAKIPARRKKKDATSELFQQVLDNVTEGTKPPPAAFESALPDAAASDATASDTASTASTASAAPVAPPEPVVPAATVSAAASEPSPDVPAASAPRRRGSKKTAAAAPAPLFATESETPAPAASAPAAAASTAPASARPAIATPAAAAASAGAGTPAVVSAARPAASTPASAALSAATLVKTPATPVPAARAAASAPASSAPAALVTAPRGVLRPAASRDVPANQPSAMAASSATDAAKAEDPDAAAAQPPHEEDAPLHRRALIRATLPRPVGEVPVRAIPTFTIREAAAARPNKFRHKGRPNGAARQSRAPIGPMSMGNNQARPGSTRGPQGRGGAAKKAGGHQPHRPGGHQPSRGKGPQGGGGNKRFK